MAAEQSPEAPQPTADPGADSDSAGLVLVGTALTPESDVVVRTAVAVARVLHARLHVAHCVPDPELPASLREAMPDLSAPPPEEQQERAAERLAAQVEHCGVADDLLAGTTVAAGHPQRRLAELAGSLGADLLVVGSREPSDGCAALLGSTASRLARRGVCPLLMVRGRPSVPPRRALATVDLSPASVAALSAGLGWLHRLGVERVEVFFVVSPFQAAVGEEAVDYDTAIAAGRRELSRLVHELGDGLSPRLTPVVRRGFPRQRILQEVEETSADLLVVGGHGRGGYERFLLGSVAEELLQRAPVSVLVLTAQSGDDDGDRGSAE